MAEHDQTQSLFSSCESFINIANRLQAYNDIFLGLVEDISNEQDIRDAQRALVNDSVHFCIYI